MKLKIKWKTFDDGVPEVGKTVYIYTDDGKILRAKKEIYFDTAFYRTNYKTYNANSVKYWSDTNIQILPPDEEKGDI